MIAKTIAKIQQEIPDNVRLIAVTKKVSVDAMRIAYDAGIRDFAENRLQEALIKQEKLADLPDICWHFIGHLQTNKSKKVVTNFHWIHAVDSLKLAQKINIEAAETNSHLQILLQVKPLPDPKKYGWEISELFNNLSELNKLENVQIKGLMTILPWGLSEQETISAFTIVKDLAIRIKQQNHSHLQMQELSMGMSGDYLSAIQAGSTMIRLGTIIFGERV